MTNPYLDNKGGVLITVLIIMVILTIASAFLVQTSILDNKMVRNLNLYKDNFNRADNGINYLKAIDDSWLAPSSSLLDLSEDDPVINKSITSIPIYGMEDVCFCKYKIARIQEDPDDKIMNNSEEFFIMPHIAPPMTGSGTSLKKFEMKRFGIKTESINKDCFGCVKIEAGVCRYFPK